MKVTEAAHARLKVLEGFDFTDVKREIDKGRLVGVLLAYTEKRLAFQTDFAQKLKQDGTLELPPARDAADKAVWATLESAPYSLHCVINGYNSRRGEVIFSYAGWGLHCHHLRMREEEMKASTFNVLIFVPEK